VKVHWEVLTSDQQHVLTASATISQRWGAYLAGGAGLALQLGHRRSADFDWFTPKTLPPSEVLKDVQTLGLPMQIRQNDEGTFLGAGRWRGLQRISISIPARGALRDRRRL
jgi:hypothetical protein